MRILLLLLFLFSFLQSSIAQDTLFRLSGESIGVKVLEITPLEIKYKLTSNLEGPTYTVLKSDVFMIEYANGSNDVFGAKAAPVDEMAQSKLASYEKSETEKLYRRQKGGGIACIVIGSIAHVIAVPFIATGAEEISNGFHGTGNGKVIPAGIGLALGIGLVSIGISSLAKASATKTLLNNSGTALHISPELLNTTAFSGPIINRGNGIGVRLSLTF